jgi:hypothetical protein
MRNNPKNHQNVGRPKPALKSRLDRLKEFENAPLDTLFDQHYLAAVRGCSVALLERDRGQGGGVPFRRIGHSIRYSKRDILAWLSQH